MKGRLKEFNIIEHLNSDKARVEYLREALRSVKEEPSGDPEGDKKMLAAAICDIARSVGIELSPVQAELNKTNDALIGKYAELVQTQKDHIATMNWIVSTTADRISDIGQKMKLLVEKDKK